MTKQDLIQFEKLSTLSPKEIEKKNPGVFAKLNEQAGVRFKKIISRKLKSADKLITDHIDKIDVVRDTKWKPGF